MIEEGLLPYRNPRSPTADVAASSPLIQSGQLISETALPPVAALGLEPIDEIDHVVEPAAGAGADASNSKSSRSLASGSLAMVLAITITHHQIRHRLPRPDDFGGGSAFLMRRTALMGLSR